jgi:hypothetical protein
MSPSTAANLAGSNIHGSNKSFEIIIGHDLLQLLSSSMYTEPMTIYREYVQNATDAIDEGLRCNLISDVTDARVTITADQRARSVTILDNGIGLSNEEIVPRLLAVGASRKKRLALRGFRGIGRLAGLGYCRELVFRSRTCADEPVVQVTWDCAELKELIQTKSELGLTAAIRSIVSIDTHIDVTAPERFFEVELRGLIRIANDKLLNPHAIASYLSQIAPVPMSPSFSSRHAIRQMVLDEARCLEIDIFVNGSKLCRPFYDTMPMTQAKQTVVRDVEFFSLPALDEGVSAFGWIAHHDYLGAFHSDSGCSGIRARCGNLQVGDAYVLDGAFREPRFNRWSVGELHIVDRRIVPNGRRDNFEHNAHYANLLNHLGPLANNISKRCRLSSQLRQANRKLITLIESTETLLSVYARIIRRSAFGKAVLQSILARTSSDVKHRIEADNASGLPVATVKRARSLITRISRLVKGQRTLSSGRSITIGRDKAQHLVTKLLALNNKPDSSELIELLFSK